MSLYDYVPEVAGAIRRFVRDHGTGHSMVLVELTVYGCDLSPMIVGRVLRLQDGAVVAKAVGDVASVRYLAKYRRISVEEPNDNG